MQNDAREIHSDSVIATFCCHLLRMLLLTLLLGQPVEDVTNVNLILRTQ